MISGITAITPILTANYRGCGYQLYYDRNAQETSPDSHVLFVNNCRTKAKITCWQDCLADSPQRWLYQIETDQVSFICYSRCHWKFKAYDLEKKSELLQRFGKKIKLLKRNFQLQIRVTTWETS